jgi:hypothetical protein
VWWLAGAVAGALIVVALLLPDLRRSIVSEQPVAPPPAPMIAPPPETAADHARHDEFVQNLFALMETTPPSDAATLGFLERSFRTVLNQDPGNILALAGLRALAQKRSQPVEAPAVTAAKPAAPPADEVADPGAAASAQDARKTQQAQATQPRPVVPAADRVSSEQVSAAISRARELMELGYFTTPPGNNAVAVLRGLEGATGDPRIQAILLECADRMVEAAVEARAAGLDYDARNLVEEVLAFDPRHERATALWRAWADNRSAVWSAQGS